MLSLLALTQVYSQSKPPKQAVTIGESGVKYLYNTWANSLFEQDIEMWQKMTSSYQQRKIRNELVSKKRNFPADVFMNGIPNLINLENLSMVSLTQNKVHAKAVFFGDLQLLQRGEGKTSKPAMLVRQSLYTIDFYAEDGWWKVGQAGVLDLRHQPELKKQLLQYQFEPIKLPIVNQLPELDPLVSEADYIGNVWVNTQGVEVDIIVNGISLGSVAESEKALLILGGLKLGKNTIKYRIKTPNNTSNSLVAAIEVFALSEKRGNKPIRLWSLEKSNKNRQPDINGFYSDSFMLTAEQASTL